jgi:hypothetical protein
LSGYVDSNRKGGTQGTATLNRQVEVRRKTEKGLEGGREVRQRTEMRTEHKSVEGGTTIILLLDAGYSRLSPSLPLALHRLRWRESTPALVFINISTRT